MILSQMFYLVESGTVAVPLQQEDPTLSNTMFLQQFLSKLLYEAFPHLQEQQLAIIIEGFFGYNMDVQGFKGHLRDFLVDCREASGQDLSTLYLAERAAAMEQVQHQKILRLQGLRGLPAQPQPEDMDAVMS